MRSFAVLAALLIFAATPTLAEDDVRLDHKGTFMDAPAADQEDISTDAVADMGGDSGSGDLAIRIERGGYGSGDSADNDVGGNGPLSRDGGFNFGPAN